MTRSFYSSAIFFTSLHIAVAFFQSIVFFQLGAQITELHSLRGWLVLVFLISLAWSLIVLQYYHGKQYRFAFWAVIISITASLFQFIALYNVLATREISTYYIIATLVVLGTGILYGASLVFSEAGERIWLKISGIFLLLFDLGMITSFIWAVHSLGFRMSGKMETIEKWTSLIGSLGPVFFVLNFLSERASAEKMVTSRQESFQGLLNFVAFAAVVSVFILGPKLALESLRISANPEQVNDYQKNLARPFEARTYANRVGDTLRYRLMVPLDHDSTKKYPLVVCLHGSSGCGKDNVKQVAASFPAHLLSSQENRRKYPAFLFVPQCPLRSSWGGIPDVHAVDSLVFETIVALEQEFAIDVNRCYVSGNSLGGYGAWHFICTRPELFAAAVPISGGGNPDLAQKIVGMPVWAFHGGKDRNVPVSGSQEIIEAIKNAGGDPRYTEFPDEAHDIWKNVTDTPGLLDWLFAQTNGRRSTVDGPKP